MMGGVVTCRLGIGLGELNIGGGGMGPISDNGMGGSGSSGRMKPDDEEGGG